MLRMLRAALSPPAVRQFGRTDWDRAGEVPYAHHTGAADAARRHRAAGDDGRAETLLEWCIDYVEHESRAECFVDVPPGYYEELADLYRDAGRYDAEVRVLERYASTVRDLGGRPRRRLLDRLAAARDRAQ